VFRIRRGDHVERRAVLGLLRDLRRGAKAERDVDSGFHSKRVPNLLESFREIGCRGHDISLRVWPCAAPPSASMQGPCSETNELWVRYSRRRRFL